MKKIAVILGLLVLAIIFFCVGITNKNMAKEKNTYFPIERVNKQLFPKIEKEKKVKTEKKKETKKVKKTTKEKTTIEEETVDEASISYAGLDEASFYSIFNSMNDVSWEDCVNAASAQWGMDEYQLRVALGWTVNEQYQYIDPYFAYMCAQCPWYHMGSAEGMASGLAGWDYSGMYGADSLVDTSYGADQYTLNLFYLAIKYPYYNIFGCDGLSWYDAIIYDELYANGYDFRVWGY